MVSLKTLAVVAALSAWVPAQALACDFHDDWDWSAPAANAPGFPMTPAKSFELAKAEALKTVLQEQLMAEARQAFVARFKAESSDDKPPSLLDKLNSQGRVHADAASRQGPDASLW